MAGRYYFSRSLALAALIWAGAAHAEPENQLEISGMDQSNRLYVSQSPDAGHRAEISLSGQGLGAGAEESWHETQGLAFGSSLQPGSLMQAGFGHRLEVRLTGTENLFAAVQTGLGHQLSGRSSGQFNQAAVIQAGTGNSVSFSQAGQRNSLVVNQSTW